MGVRRESVELSLADIDFTSGMAKAVAETALLNRELDKVDGSSVRASRSTTALGSPNGGIAKTGTAARKASNDLNQYTGRLSLLATVGATLGPALLPISAAAIPAVTALAASLGVTVGAVGTAVLAFHGLGEALTALNQYQLDPSKEHLKKLHETLGKLSPAAQDLVMRLDSLGPVLERLQRAAQNGLFPGVDEGLTQVLTLLPEVETIVSRLASELGQLTTQAGVSLAHDADWQAFFHWLETDAITTLDEFARATGNFVAGLGSILVAFQPLDHDITAGLLRMSRGFREWAANLDENSTFQDFVDYVRESGPQVRAFFAAMGDALVALARAAAPWGSMMLPLLTDVAKVFAVIADSPIGPGLYTAAAAMLTLKAASGFLGNMSTNLGKVGINADRASKGLGGLTARVGGIILLGQALGTLANSVNSGNAINDFDLGRDISKITSGGTTASLEKLSESLEDVNERGAGTVNTLFAIPSALFGVQTSFEGGKSTIEAFDQQLAQLVENGHADQAAVLFANIRAAAASHGGVSDADVVKSFDSYKTALDNAKTSTTDLTGATRQYGSTAGTAAIRAAELAKSLDAQRKSARDTGKSFMAFGDSLNDSKVSLSQWITDLQNQAKALRDFTKNAQTAAKRGLREGLIKELEAAGPAGALRLKQLANASDSEIARANKAWKAGRDAIRAYVNMNVPPKRIDVNADGAISAVEALQARLRRLDGKRVTSYIDIVQRGANAKRSGLPTPGPGYAGGGYTGRGGKYEPAGMVHRREFVFSSEATDGNEAFLDGLHRRLRGYAEGGLVGPAAGFGVVVNRGRAGEIADMTVQQIHRLGREFDDLSRRRLAKLSRALDRAATLQERQTDAAKTAFDAVVERRSSIASGITSSLTGDLFSADGGGAFSSSFAPGSIGAVTARLRQQIRDANEQAALERQLSARGVSGAALQAVIEQGGLAGLRSFAASSNSDLATYQTLFGQRTTAIATAANTGAAILTPEFNALQTAANQQTAELKAIRQELRQAQRTRRQAPAQTARHLNQSAGSARGKRR